MTTGFVHIHIHSLTLWKSLSFTTHVNAITDQGMGKPLLYIMPTKMWKQCKTTCTCLTRGYAPTNNWSHTRTQERGGRQLQLRVICVYTSVCTTMGTTTSHCMLLTWCGGCPHLPVGSGRALTHRVAVDVWPCVTPTWPLPPVIDIHMDITVQSLGHAGTQLCVHTLCVMM